MNAETFHQKATALQRKGMMAVFSKDLKVLMKEGQATGDVVNRRRQATLKAGGKPRYCPPPASPRKMGAEEFMTRLGAIPRADRQKIDMTEAMNRILARKFPC
jgi:hypothetical protein